MNTNMNVTIRRLMNAFIILFLVISAVAAYVQIGNQAFFGGPALASGQYDPRHCPPYDQPVRGTIYDRNGQWLARSVPDSNAPCGYRREYYDQTLAPLIGYFSYRYGTAGLESSFNDQLAGVQHGETFQDATSKLLHKPRYGQDIYLTIDDKVQKYADSVYNSQAIFGNVCQPAGSDPPGAIIVEDPNSGEILAMVSHPYYDANQITQDDANAAQQYFQQLNSDPGHPLLNHATQALYDPGSTFKTVTLAAALDTGKFSLDTQFSKDEAVHFSAEGDIINWDDYNSGTWSYIPDSQLFPLSVENAYAYSDNVVFARAAVTLGADTWLSYVRKFGIATPGTDVPPVPYDGPSTQSSAYNATTNGKQTDFNVPLLAESGFGQGQLFVTPLTMEEVASTMAAGGVLWVPHTLYKTVTHGENSSDVLPTAKQAYTGTNIIRPETAQAVRHAMASVVQYGTAYAGLTSPTTGEHLSASPTHEGGKTGTGQTSNSNPETWWISLAPDDQAPGGSAAKYAIALHKEKSGEGACQVFVTDSIYRRLLGL